MFTKNDLDLLQQKGITTAQVEEQLQSFATGFPYLAITASASVGQGITVVEKERQLGYIEAWENYLAGSRKVVKFVPASGAASRMFKQLYEFLSGDGTVENNDVKQFFEQITRFAFFPALDAACIKAEGKGASDLIKEGKHRVVTAALLEPWGINYGQLPKGLLLFHAYPDGTRTAMEEHLAEGAMYAKNKQGQVNIHFTVSEEHRVLFEKLVAARKINYEDRYSVSCHVTFSVQKPNTDTIAADSHNQPFRNNDGSLLFRPGGHGALIENLTDIAADVIFIKNIDNVVPDSFKCSTLIYKKVIAGVLVTLQKRIHRYLEVIESGKYSHQQVEEMIHFLQDDLCIRHPEIKYMEDAELILYIKNKLDRPLRVCGMVRNAGEPGGGPFLVTNADGSISPQILESSQIDMNNAAKKALFEQGTHFNPVDLVCAVCNHKGEKYHLPDYVDKSTGFISHKSKDGKTLQALELPGLWNGAMSNWNTVFVEVPIDTFNPVKTVNDLLRPEHQQAGR